MQPAYHIQTWSRHRPEISFRTDNSSILKFRSNLHLNEGKWLITLLFLVSSDEIASTKVKVDRWFCQLPASYKKANSISSSQEKHFYIHPFFNKRKYARLFLPNYCSVTLGQIDFACAFKKVKVHINEETAANVKHFQQHSSWPTVGKQSNMNS